MTQSPNAESEIPSSQVDFEIGFFGHILERYPGYVDVLKCQAELLAGKRRHSETLVCDERLAELLPRDPQVRYHLACSLANLNRLPESIQALTLALEYGYRDFDHLESDPDLEPLREHPDFKAVLKAYSVLG